MVGGGGGCTISYTQQLLPVGNSAEGLVASGSRTLGSAAGGGTKDARPFTELALETSKEMVVDNLLNRKLQRDTPSYRDILLVVELSGEINRATHCSPML